MEFDEFTVYCILGFIGFVSLSVLYLTISQFATYKTVSNYIKPLVRSVLRRVGYIFFGLALIGLGIDFLWNPVHYSARAQYDLRGWTKYLAAFVCFIPGVYSAIVGLTPLEKTEEKTK
jgi:hypothetical protein